MKTSRLVIVRLFTLILLSPSVARAEGIGNELTSKQTARFEAITSTYASTASDETKIQLRSQLSELYKTTANTELKDEIHSFLQENPYPKTGLATATTTTSAKTTTVARRAKTAN